MQGCFFIGEKFIFMWNNLYPDLYLNSIYELEPQFLKDKGIRGIILDMDNTLVPWGSMDIDPEMIKWIKYLKDEGFRLCVVSNNSPVRGENLSSQVGLPGVWNANKPLRKAFRRALKKMELRPEETAAVGDQVFTDVLGGNRLGLFTVLVPQLTSKDFVWTRIMRRLEKIVLRRINTEKVEEK